MFKNVILLSYAESKWYFLCIRKKVTNLHIFRNNNMFFSLQENMLLNLIVWFRQDKYVCINFLILCSWIFKVLLKSIYKKLSPHNNIKFNITVEKLIILYAVIISLQKHTLLHASLSHPLLSLFLSLFHILT